MNIQLSLRSELIKTKGTASIYLAVAAAAFAPMMSMLEMSFDGIDADLRPMILQYMFTQKYQVTNFFILPIFIMLICTLLPQLEYKNHAWKQVLSSPQTKANIYLAKFINVQLLIFLFIFCSQVFMLINAVILHFMYPDMHVLSQPFDVTKVIKLLAKDYLALLALCSIQFWLGMRFRNFIAPIGIGLALWFIGSLIVMQFRSPAGYYNPYSFHVYGSFPEWLPTDEQVIWTSVVYALVFLVLGYMNFRRKRMG